MLKILFFFGTGTGSYEDGRPKVWGRVYFIYNNIYLVRTKADFGQKCQILTEFYFSYNENFFQLETVVFSSGHRCKLI